MGHHGRNEATGSQETRRKTFGYLGLPEAPVFHPTEEEFSDPLTYIEQIREEAEAYGLCRIVPPETWKPSFAIDTKTFSFPTKLQEIHNLQMRPAACDSETFKLEYSRFLEKEGRKVESRPLFGGKQLDLCKLFSAVKRHGGFQKVKKDKKWGEVLQILDPSYVPLVQSNSLQSLCQMYETHLYGYEVYQSNSSCGKRYRRSNMLEESYKLRGKKTGKQCTEGEQKAAVGDICSGIQKLEEADEMDLRLDQVCEQCHSGAHEQLMLLCDRCDRGWHLYCLTPPLSEVPTGNWYCFDCLASETESFGFTPGVVHSFDSFKRVAERFKKKWFGAKETSYSEVEEEFWSVVERSKGPVEVLYGSDLATEVYGSGFPRSSDLVPACVEDTLWKEYAASPWNLNNFAKIRGSLLQHVQENIPGVIVPWLYVGMLFSSFCWHYEDQCFYSINYLHWGEPKCWYSVPGSAVNAFEQVMHKTFPDLFEAQPDLLFQLVTMLNPKVLCENAVPVCSTIQERGHFVVTFPRSYHCGFNLGFNCAEAVNFATADWLPFGRFGVERARLFHKAVVLSHEELVCVIAKNAQGSEISPWVKKELNHIITIEQKQRERLWKNGVIRSSRIAPHKIPEVIGMEEDPECMICGYYLYISALTCSCCPGKSVCLQHSEQLCECSMEQHQLLYRYSLAELDNLQLEIQRTVNADPSLSSESFRGKQRRRCRQSESTMVMKKVNGSMVSQTKLAEIWVMKAQSVLQSTSKLSTIENLLMEAEEFLWAGHEMDPVRLLETELRSAQNWAQGVARCLAATDIDLEDDCLEKASLVTAQQLLAVNPVPCDMKDSISELKALVDTAINLQQQIKSLFFTSPPWQLIELESLYQELLQLPLKFPEAQRLEDVVNSARIWGENVQSLLFQPRLCWTSGHRNTTDIYKLHLLQLEAEELSVLLPEMKILDAFISKLERWQEQAKELLGTAEPLEVVEARLLEIENVPVYIPEAEILEQRVFEAHEWIRCAFKVLADVQQQSYYSASSELLSALLRTGESLKIKVTEVDLVKAELRKVSWLERAAKGLQSRSTSKDLMEILEEAEKLSLQNEKIYSEIYHIVEAARVWESKAAHFLEKGASLDDYRNLRRDSGKIYASLSGWVDINMTIIQAESFLHHAQPFINRNGYHDTALDIDTLQELVSESHNLKVHLPETHLLYSAHAEVELWRKNAIILVQSAKHGLQTYQLMDQFDTDLAIVRVNTRLLLGNDQLLTNMRQMVTEGTALGFKLSELAELHILITATEWNLKASNLLSGCPSVQELEVLVEEASSFSEHVGQLKLILCVLSKAKTWLQKAKNALQRQDSGCKCTVSELEELLAEAKVLPVCVSSDAAHLEGILTSHKAWQNKVSKYFYSPNQLISWEELQHLQEIGKMSPIESNEAKLLVNEVVTIEKWISKCRVNLLGESESISRPLKDVFSEVQASVDRAVQQFQSNAPMGMEELCCFCRKSFDCASNTMRKCDTCKDRFHSSCIGGGQSQERVPQQFVCPFCDAITTGILCLDEAILSKVCITKRPTVSTLQELLNAAKTIRVRMEEIVLLQGIIQSVQAWHRHLDEILEPILHQHTNNTHSPASLLYALKIAGTMEVQEDDNSKLALAISMNAWRMHARTMLESPTKPSYRSVCRILKEGLSIPALLDDCHLKDLKRWEGLASEWVNHAKKTVQDNGVMALEDVFKLIIEGERLPVAFGKELTALKSRTVLYCICRKPYDRERAMIACDCCSEWYHFDCVNLPEPESSDDECEKMLQSYGSDGEFVCPNCQNLGNRDTSRLISKFVQNSQDLLKDDDTVHGSLCTPPFWYAKGKRSSRSSVRVRADLQGKWNSHSIVSECSNDVPKETSQTCLSASGRPCRRTAGQCSRFESFVLLTHTG